MDFVIDVDADEILTMLDALGPAAETHVHEASGVTAEHVKQEWRSRVRRATGRYAESIRVDEAGEPMFGFRIYPDKMSDPDGGMRAVNFPIWQEEGTRHMAANPARQAAVDLEQGPHLDRISEALQAAIDQENS